ncbi:MAG: acetylxylan esterase [Planctomycetaceae bacterium]|nr:acetylxylan esterase [Planctomycetaceae bacterium]MCB9950859.1 acetylxylan esterase [Planctomycetaceae bacterium]
MQRFLGLLALVTACSSLLADDVIDGTAHGNSLLRQYFEIETAKVTENCLADIKTLADWEAKKEQYRDQLREMLGLNPWPERTDLNVRVTGVIEQDDFVVEKLHYESSPGLFVTANLYRPKVVTEKLPAVLYVCGHARVNENGISYGNKVGYHHHGCWFARNGYVCLTIDTIQLGEIQGLHHGTFREGMWWWASRGYTPAGVEAWNGIRGLDYLESRPEVDASRIGVTGRSGGGAYSWWVAALDERIKCAVPVAGITSMHNHIVDDCIEGHCDCMFMVNTYQWDFPVLAALVAPRPLLISNTDKDTIFPLEGVVDVHSKVRRIYELYGKPRNLGLHITEGPHKDTQELRAHAFVWLNRFLKGSEEDIAMPAVKMFDPPQLRVFGDLPGNEQVTNVHDWFVPQADAADFPKAAHELKQRSAEWVSFLKEKSLRAWPASTGKTVVEKSMGLEFADLGVQVHHFESQAPYQLPLILVSSSQPNVPKNGPVTIHVMDESDWLIATAALAKRIPRLSQHDEFAIPSTTDVNETVVDKFLEDLRSTLKENPSSTIAILPCRGIGPTRWTSDAREQIHIRRRFLLLGQSLDALRGWDVLQAIRAVKGLRPKSKENITLKVSAGMEVPALLASTVGEPVDAIEFVRLPTSFKETPALLNAMKELDIPQLILLALGQGTSVEISQSSDEAKAVWENVRSSLKSCGGSAELLQF